MSLSSFPLTTCVTGDRDVHSLVGYHYVAAACSDALIRYVYVCIMSVDTESIMCSKDLSPGPFPAFQCSTLKSGSIVPHHSVHVWCPCNPTTKCSQIIVIHSFSIEPHSQCLHSPHLTYCTGSTSIMRKRSSSYLYRHSLSTTNASCVSVTSSITPSPSLMACPVHHKPFSALLPLMAEWLYGA